MEEQNQLNGFLFMQQYLAQLIMCAGKLSCFSHVQLCETLWTIAHQAPLYKGFFRQEYRSGLPCPLSADLPNLGVEPSLLCLPHSQADSLSLVPLGKPTIDYTQLDIFLLALRNTLLFLALCVLFFSFVKSGEIVCTS